MPPVLERAQAQGPKLVPPDPQNPTPNQVEKMVSEADRFAEEDKKKREAVEAKNGAESLVYQTEKQLKEFADKVRGSGLGARGGSG